MTCGECILYNMRIHSTTACVRPIDRGLVRMGLAHIPYLFNILYKLQVVTVYIICG